MTFSAIQSGACSSPSAKPNRPEANAQPDTFASCTCTEREDQLCVHLKDTILNACTKPTPPPPSPGDNSITSSPDDFSVDISSSSSPLQIVFPSVLLCALLAARLFLEMF
ncbi:unnamed protein product [Heligmosomoides polygyrus]|uniref:GDNF domain-containing protein n=1 Tax=Heligmosomoides polygyrus TaxID=6339 RepID=A0A183GR29_HELPZ|nr:unnamed protein product [Heligmosomoides polygyrus]